MAFGGGAEIGLAGAPDRSTDRRESSEDSALPGSRAASGSSNAPVASEDAESSGATLVGARSTNATPMPSSAALQATTRSVCTAIDLASPLEAYARPGMSKGIDEASAASSLNA